MIALLGGRFNGGYVPMDRLPTGCRLVVNGEPYLIRPDGIAESENGFVLFCPQHWSTPR
jgi:hypothetical protein